MSVGLVFIATGRYREFVAQFVASARAHFHPDDDVRLFALTDADIHEPGVTRLAVAHAPWPRVTLERYHAFVRHADVLAGVDFLFYSDVDMRFVARCDAAILPPDGQGLVATLHPGYYRRNDGWLARLSLRARAMGFGRGLGWHVEPPFESDPRSRAALPDDPLRPYFCGGFNGGETSAFLEMARSIRDAVDDDASRGIVAAWHDESHLNHYLAHCPPHVLSPRYCFPESGYPNLAGLEPVLLALDKDHEALRA